ncbi:hypothetical protein O3Q51_13900 [Cryomorphaceae bacterium 1068]|nr:hypothetical protein [Cryomorphaceae bacterium 1068]
MEEYEIFTLARVVHVLGVVLWIGGVAMVTLVILPSLKQFDATDNRIEAFERIEGRFARVAKITTLITGLTGFYMLYEMDAWNRYLDYRYWWIHAMTLVWILFTIILFVLEPFVLKKRMAAFAESHPEKVFTIMQRAHWVLLIISLMTIAGVVAGSHGWQWMK